MGILSTLLDDRSGSVAVEYCLLVALMAMVIIGVLTTVAETIKLNLLPAATT